MSTTETHSSITVYCPECEAPFHLPNRELLGHQARCWSCKEKVVLEEPISEADSTEVPADFWEDVSSSTPASDLELEQSAICQPLPATSSKDQPSARETSLKQERATQLLREEASDPELVNCGYCQTRVPLVGQLLETDGCPCCGAKVASIQFHLVDAQPQWAQRAGLFIEEKQQGAFGTIYHGIHINRNCRVSIRKVSDDCQPPQSIQDVLGGLWQMRQRVQGFDVGFDEMTLHQDEVYLIGRPIRGTSLADHLAGNSLTNGEMAQFGWRLADVLSSAHRQGLLHRDLKPANVLVTPQSLEVLGFGLPRRKTGGGYLKGPQGLVVGTVAYLAPEQALGNGPMDPRSDIYSLGVLLFQMLTGQLPFYGTLTQVLNQIAQKPLPSVTTIRPDLPWEWDVVCRRCTAKKPEDRYQSASELREILEQF